MNIWNLYIGSLAAIKNSQVVHRVKIVWAKNSEQAEKKFKKEVFDLFPTRSGYSYQNVAWGSFDENSEIFTQTKDGDKEAHAFSLVGVRDNGYSHRVHIVIEDDIEVALDKAFAVVFQAFPPEDMWRLRSVRHQTVDQEKMIDLIDEKPSNIRPIH